MQYFVYIIGNKENLREISPYYNCYVGVTNRPEYRWKCHARNKSKIGEYIRKNNLNYEENMKIIFFGEKEKCFELEKKLRPLPNIGLNESVGGLGGYTKYTKERNKKISKSLKGRDVSSWIHEVNKIKKENGSVKGNKNPRAKKWTILDPEKKKYILHGNLQEFCDENDLLVSALRRYIGSEVPNISYNEYGGYRPKSVKSKHLRENTTGWSLFEE